MTAVHHLKLFGVPQLLDPAGVPVGLRTKKQLALLVYLAIEARDRPVERDVLVELLWPDTSEDRARHSLSQALTALRKPLGAGSITRTGDAVRLLGPITTDIDARGSYAFESRDMAHPLDGMETWAGTSFAHWVEGIRARCLKDVRSSLLADLSTARRKGQVKVVHERAALLYEVDPLNDIAALSLAERFLLEQDTTGAISLLRSHASRSKSETGRQLDREMHRLLQRVERNLVTEGATADSDQQKSASLLSRPEIFVGREEELAQLESIWARTRRGNLCTCLVSGPNGIGKSSLIRRFCTSITARTWPAYVVACQEIGKGIPFAAISDLVHRLARDPALSGTDPLWLSEVSRVSPRLRSIYPGIPEPAQAPAEAVRIRVAEAIHMMFEAVSDGGPIAVGFDNIHNMDPASRDVLHMLVKRLQDSATLILGTFLCDERDSLVPTAPATHSGIEWGDSLYLGPLDDVEARELLANFARDSEVPRQVLEKIAQLAQGIPYLTEMLYSEWERDPAHSLAAVQMQGDGSGPTWHPPQTMRLAFARQYQGLSSHALHMLHLLAVAERVLPTGEVASLLSVDKTVVDHAALELIDRALVRMDGGAFGFKNELHRAFVYYAMSEDAQAFHHARLAQTLAASREADDFQRALEASHHFAKARMIDDAVRAVCAGADLAVKRGAPKEAERALQVVMERCPEDQSQPLHLLMAESLNARGRYHESLKALASWRGAKTTIRHEALAATIRAEALHRGRLADDEQIMRASSLASEFVEECDDELIAMRSLQVQAEVASERGDWADVNVVRVKAARIEDAASHPSIKARALLTQGYCLLVAGEASSAVAHFQKCLTILEPLSLDPDKRQALNGIGLAYTCSGAFEQGIEAFHRSVDIATRIGDSVAVANGWGNLGAVYEDIGKFDTAEDCYRTAFSQENIASNPRRAVEANLNMASLRMVTEDMSGARQCIDIAKVHAEASQLWWLYTDVLLAESDLQIACARQELAWPLVEAAQAHTKGRTYMLADMGRYERLSRHHIWRCHGFDAMLRLSDRGDLRQRCIQISDQLEVLAFEEWVTRERTDNRTARRSAFDRLKDMGLHGVTRRLRTLRVAPS